MSGSLASIMRKGFCSGKPPLNILVKNFNKKPPAKLAPQLLSIQPLKQDILVKSEQEAKDWTTKILDHIKTIYGESTIPEVCAIEKKLAQLGVNVSCENDINVAKSVLSAIEKLKAKGFEVPRNIFIMSPQNPNLGGFCPLSIPKGIKSCIFIKKEGTSFDIKDVKNPDNFLKWFEKTMKPSAEKLEQIRFQVENGINHNATHTLEGTIFHEIGHFLHNKTKLPTDVAQDVWFECYWRLPDRKARIDLMKEVSYYAVKGDKEYAGQEFVAEVFAGLMSGKKYSEHVMKYYEKLRGPKVL